MPTAADVYKRQGHEELHRRTDALAAEMKMQINVTRQEVFDAMHTI